MKRIALIVTLLFVLGCKEKDHTTTTTETGSTPFSPESFNVAPLQSLFHDTSSFTEGFLIYKGSIYESTGNYGKSKLLKINIGTGKTEKEVSLDPKYFGEGISIVHDTIYQLTYQENTVLVYDMNFKKIKEMPFATDRKEGWGMTTDGHSLIVSDGSNNLYYFEPSTFKLINKVSITDGGSQAYNINELEYINGFIYANQWQLPYIFKIDPQKGIVVAKADISELWDKATKKDGNAVPNGIAYDSATKKTYITGKLWPNTYEVQFSK